jgi:hypothetical protein
MTSIRQLSSGAKKKLRNAGSQVLNAGSQVLDANLEELFAKVWPMIIGFIKVILKITAITVTLIIGASVITSLADELARNVELIFENDEWRPDREIEKARQSYGVIFIFSLLASKGVMLLGNFNAENWKIIKIIRGISYVICVIWIFEPYASLPYHLSRAVVDLYAGSALN